MSFEYDDLFKPESSLVTDENKAYALDPNSIKKYTPLILVLGGLLLIMFN